MKTLFRLPLAVVLFASACLPAMADGVVTTGIVESVSLPQGTMTVRSDQTKRPMVFFGLGAAMLVNGNNGPATLADLKAGIPVTVRYAARGKDWYVEKITYGDTKDTPAATGTATKAAVDAGNVAPKTTVPAIPVQKGTSAAPLSGPSNR
jgi:hypothetical protein